MNRPMERVADALKIGRQHHHCGRFSWAEEIYLEILDNVPDQPEALYLLGILALQLNRPELAVDRIRRAGAIHAGAVNGGAINGGIRGYHLNLGLAWMSLGRPEEAEPCFRQALAARTTDVEAFRQLCGALGALGRQDEAGRLLRAGGCDLPVRFRLDNPRAGAGARQPVVALTIDDGPSPEVTPWLLATLARFRATATFFVVGARAERHPDLVRAMVEGGHEVFGHGYSHRPFTALSAADIQAEMERAEACLRPFRPSPIAYPVRLPYGQGWAEPAVHAAVRGWNPDSVFVQWSVDLRDWAIAGDGADWALAEEAVVATVRQAVAHRALPGSILLVHDRLADKPSPLGDRVSRHATARLLQDLTDAGVAVGSLGDAAGLVRWPM